MQLDNLQVSLPNENGGTKSTELDRLGSFQATRPVTDAALARANISVCMSSILLMGLAWFLLALPFFIGSRPAWDAGSAA